MSRTHECPAPGCDEQVPQVMLACRRHWYSIPKHVRDELWRAYDDGAGMWSDAHVAAMDACIEFLEADAEAVSS